MGCRAGTTTSSIMPPCSRELGRHLIAAVNLYGRVETAAGDKRKPGIFLLVTCALITCIVIGNHDFAMPLYRAANSERLSQEITGVSFRHSIWPGGIRTQGTIGYLSKIRQQLRPLVLAAYRALSAESTKASRSLVSSARDAIPKLIVILNVCSS